MSRRPARTTRPAALLAAVALVSLVVGVWWGGHPAQLPGFMRRTLVTRDSNAVISQAVNRILGSYYRPLRRSQLIDSSLEGVVASLHDRFSTYLTPAQFKAFNSSSDEGIGVDVVTVPSGQLVVLVFDNSPAKRAGIVSGDVITAANGHKLRRASGTVAAGLIRGAAGTTVVLEVGHRGHMRQIRVTRAVVLVPVVASRMRMAGGIKIGQVALATFSFGAHGQVRNAIDKLLRQGARAIVLDLRHNGGGLVEEARLIASIFIKSGTIVTTRGRSEPTQTMSAAGGAIRSSIPVAVLVDDGTASAAEIVAGALQDYHRATIVGSHTFGKGVFEEVRQLANGGALDITVGEFFLPSGRNLGGGGIQQGSGITPDVPVAAPARPGEDPALAAALRVVVAKLR